MIYADIILPANTTLEVEDIVTNTRQGPHFQSVAIQEQAIHPIGESKSDYEIVLAIAEKLGYGEQFSEGKTTLDLQKEVLSNHGNGTIALRWDEFYEKKYYVFPTAKDWESDPPGFRKFYEDPEKQPASHTYGQAGILLRAAGQALPGRQGAAAHSQVDREERNARRAPFQRTGCHVPAAAACRTTARWRTHAQGDDISWTREIRHLQSAGFGRLPVRTVLDQSRRTPPRAALKTAILSRCLTREASCCAGRACGNG